MTLRIALLALLGFSFSDASAADKRVARALKKAGIDYVLDADDDFQILVATGTGRRQVVWIRSQTSHYEGIEVRDVFSYGVVLDDHVEEGFTSEFLEELIGRRYKVGGWMIQQGRAACFNVTIDAAAKPGFLRGILLAVGNAADDVEAQVSPDEDKF